ncbi:hypothetical protein B0H10DRAFT_1953825 [Mycena sp. CBHHK59/15]|nr:hypothetical protein B0H10DRAFT_1953825 [Mycena sp. CBHHK59/15]
MPFRILYFGCFSSKTDSSSDLKLDFDALVGPPRRHAEEPPQLSSSGTNLFDTFPRVAFGGYQRYYVKQWNASKEPLVTSTVIRKRSQAFQPSLASIAEDLWSWKNLPKFTGRKPRRKYMSAIAKEAPLPSIRVASRRFGVPLARLTVTRTAIGTTV